MPDFTSALYLGMRHLRDELDPWPRFTTGKPAALEEDPGAHAVARQIALRLPRTAGELTVTLIGHTDPVGDASYNRELGRRRAESVRRALVDALERLKPGSAKRIALRVESRGEEQPASRDPARNGRVEILSRVVPAGPAPRPSSCGVPRGTVLHEIALELEIQDLETTAPAVGVGPRLCLFQNSSERSHRNHFQCGAPRAGRERDRQNRGHHSSGWSTSQAGECYS